MSDWQYLLWAMRQAKRYGLTEEFKHWYLSGRLVGHSVKEACWHALYEWDLVPLESYGVEDPRGREK